MNDELVDCFNCGRSNPEWAQVCRSCGVPLRHGEPLLAPSGRIPTDRDSLLSIGAVIGTILLAVVLGLIISGLNPVDPTVGFSTPSPTASPTPEPTESAAPSESAPPPTATPVPGPAGTLVFGIALDQNRQVVEPVNTFTPGMRFAHSFSVPQPFGVSNVGEQIVRVLPDSTEEEVIRAIDNQVQVRPDATTAGFEIADAGALIEEWGPGLYVMRIYAGDLLLAQEQFTLAEG
jgi:hypothetical protein